MVVSRRRPARRKRLEAGPFEAEVGSFRLHLAAEGKAGRTLDTYCEAVRWFAAAHLLRETGKTRWEQVDRQDLLATGILWRPDEDESADEEAAGLVAAAAGYRLTAVEMHASQLLGPSTWSAETIGGMDEPAWDSPPRLRPDTTF